MVKLRNNKMEVNDYFNYIMKFITKFDYLRIKFR